VRAGQRRVEFGRGVAVVAVEDAGGDQEDAEVVVAGREAPGRADQRGVGVAGAEAGADRLGRVLVVGGPGERRGGRGDGGGEFRLVFDGGDGGEEVDVDDPVGGGDDRRSGAAAGEAGVDGDGARMVDGREVALGGGDEGSDLVGHRSASRASSGTGSSASISARMR
jgi:hypothetical protein